MPPKVSASATGALSNMTAREQELLSMAWTCLEVEPKIDVKKFAKVAGMSDGGASNAWRNIRNKLGLSKKIDDAGDEAGAATTNTPKTPKSTGGGRKRKVNASAGGDDEVESPTAKKGRGKKGKVMKVEDVDDEDTMEGADADGAEEEVVVKEEEA